VVVLHKCSGPCGKKLPWTAKYFRRFARSASGFAYMCKTCMDTRNKSWWESHRETQNLKVLARRKQRRAAGKCDCCEQPRIQYSSRCCLDHWFKRMSLVHFHTKSYGPALKQMAERQGYVCVYSGEQLTPGLNMSLDHIEPKSKNPLGRFDLANVQWVTTDINKAKGTLNHTAFVSLCEKVYKRALIPPRVTDYDRGQSVHQEEHHG
jgi:5-methylcytosine-specific restriction endonuclease McrA